MRKDNWKIFLFSLLAILGTFLVPVLLSTRKAWWHRGGAGPLSEPFEIFALCVLLALATAGFVWRRRLAALGSNRRVVAAVFLVLVLHALVLIASTEQRSWDYRCYENAARALVAQQDPYADGCYLYPPALAQLLSGSYEFVHSLWPSPSSSYDSWWLVFFWYQACQFYLFVLAAWLCLSLGMKRLGENPWNAVAIGAVLLLAGPLNRTFRFQQANLVSLCALSYAFLSLEKDKLASGGFLAISLFIKPYLALVFVAYALGRRWRTLLGFMLTAFLVLAISSSIGSGRALYAGFVHSLQPITAYNALLRNQSLLSLVWNSARATGTTVDGALVALIVQVLYFGLLVWAALRLARRSRLTLDRASEPVQREETLGGNLADLVIFPLVLSPLAWPHAYLILLPVLIWSFGSRRLSRRMLITASVLILLPVTFEIFPLSYHRLAGALLLLLAGVAPKRRKRSRAEPAPASSAST